MRKLLVILFGSVLVTGCSFDLPILPTKDTASTLQNVEITDPAANSYINASNKAAFTVSGTCNVNGATIVITGAASGTTPCTAGSFSKALDFSSASDGSATVKLAISDANGKISADSRTFLKDTVVPVLTLLNNSFPSTNTIDFTYLTIFPLGGACSEEGKTVTVRTADSSQTIPCTGNTWNIAFDFTSSPAGPVTVTAEQTDDAGNVGTKTLATLSKGATVPQLSLSSPAANFYANIANSSSFSVSGACSEAGNAVNITAPVTTSVVCSVGHTWSTSIDVSGLPDDDFSVTYDHTDNLGQTVSGTKVFKKDTVAPTIALTSFTGGQIVAGGSLQSISFTASDNNTLPATPIKLDYSTDSGVTYAHSIAASAANSTYAWLTPSVNSTTARLLATVTDVAGNTATSASAADFTINFLPPVLTLTSPVGGEFWQGADNKSITYSATSLSFGTLPIKLEYSSNDGTTWSTLTAGTANSGTYPWFLPPGNATTYKVRVTATDTSGLSTVVTSGSFTIDSVRPTISALTVNGGTTVAGGNILPISLTATDATSGIEAYRFSTYSDFRDAVWQTSLPSTFTFPLVPGSTNTYSLYAQVRDRSGFISNTFTSSNSVTITLGLPPTVSLVSHTQSSTYSTGNTVAILWQAAAGGNSLASNGTNIYYSLNDGGTLVAWPSGSNLSPTTNGGCALSGGATGCVDLTLPVALNGTKFRIVVSVRDNASNSASAISILQNSLSGLKLLAGRNGAVSGQTGLSYALSYNSGLARDPLTGDLLIGSYCQILIQHADTGIIDNWAGDKLDCGDTGNQFVGDGQNLDQVRFRMSFFKGDYSSAPVIIFDSSRNVYWATQYGIWKYVRATGKVQLFVGNLSGSGTNNPGETRRNFDCNSHDHDCMNISSLDLGVNGNLYFSVGTKWDPYASVLWRVENDDTLTNFAGSTSDPLTAPTVGASATTVGFWNYAIYPDTANSSDHIFAIGVVKSGGGNCAGGDNCTSNGIWDITSGTAVKLLDMTGSTSSKNGPDNFKFDHYLPKKKAFAYTFNGKICFLNPDNPEDPGASPTVPCLTLPQTSTDKELFCTAEDSTGGIYVTTNSSQQISYYADSTLNTVIRYSGIVANSGDGGLATEAELRTPQQVTQDSSGNYYFMDHGNSRIRKVNTSKTISLLYSGLLDQLSLESGNPSTMLLSDPFHVTSSLTVGNLTDVNNIGAEAVFTSGPSGTYAPLATWGAISGMQIETASPDNHWIVDTHVATDGSDRYIHFMEVDSNNSNNFRSSIKKISGGVLSEIAGGGSDASGILKVTNGQAMAGNSAGRLFSAFRVAGGVVFMTNWSGSAVELYSGEPGGNWVLQQTGIQYDYGFAVGSAKTMYYFKQGDTQLYKKVYATNGSGAETVVADFATHLKAPKVQFIDNVIANTIVLTDGDSIYTYTDAAIIP